MSRITICDLCTKTIEEDELYTLTIKKQTGIFTSSEESGDLCPDCVRKVKTLLFPSKEAGVAAPTSNEHSEKASPNVPTAIVPEERMKCK